MLSVTACDEFTPMADGYFTIDGTQYKVHVMSIYREAFNQNSMEISLQGASAYNVSVSLTGRNNNLEAGTYNVGSVPKPMGLHWLRFQRGDVTAGITSDVNSSGQMTVSISDKTYTADFSGVLQGHTIQFHYSGLVVIR